MCFASFTSVVAVFIVFVVSLLRHLRTILSTGRLDFWRLDCSPRAFLN